LAYSNLEVIIALSTAGLINMAMVIMAAGAFHEGHRDVAEIETAYHTLGPLLGIGAAGIFLLALIASGISSSVVGTMAGQMIMQGFIGFRIPLWIRRVVVMVPSFAVVGFGANATNALVISQVVLSLALPFPMTALVWFSAQRDIMGIHRNRAFTTILATIAATVVLSLNAILLLQTVGVTLPLS
jgi:manganese transport protein